MEIFLTARLGASRLPHKHLRTMIADRTCVALLVERLKETDLPVCGVIPVGAEDDPLAAALAAAGAESFRGDPENVLLRYRQAMAARGAKAAVIVDADDVFVSIGAARALAAHAPEGVVRWEGLPFGGAPYLLGLDAVDALLGRLDDVSGWGRYLDEIPVARRVLRDERFTETERGYRLTLDYEEDLRFHRALYERLYRGRPLRLGEVVAEISRGLADYRARFPSLFDGSVQEAYRRHLPARDASRG